jgi:hypothetical protein
MVFDLQRKRPAAEARSRGRQKEVAGDKGQWALISEGWNQLLKQGLAVGKGREWEIRKGGLCSARSETSCGLCCRRGSSYQVLCSFSCMTVWLGPKFLSENKDYITIWTYINVQFHLILFHKLFLFEIREIIFYLKHFAGKLLSFVIMNISSM